MAYKINLHQPTVSFTINGHDFDVDGSDEKLTNFNEKYKRLLSAANSNKENLQENEETYRDLVKETMDELLGQGAFDLLYTEVPSVIILFDALNQIVDKLMMEMLDRMEIESAKIDTIKKVKRFGGK